MFEDAVRILDIAFQPGVYLQHVLPGRREVDTGEDHERQDHVGVFRAFEIITKNVIQNIPYEAGDVLRIIHAAIELAGKDINPDCLWL